MAKQNVVIDSVNDSFNAKYQTNGVVYASNIDTVNTRDEAGNIVYRQGEINPLLIIDAISENIINQSVLKVVNTQFNYFKFPARTNVVVEEDFDLGFDPSEFNVLPEPLPPIPAEYAPSAAYILPEGNFGNMFTIDLKSVVEGPPQTKPGKFVITQDLLDTLETAWGAQNMTASLSVTGKITTRYYNKGAGDRNSAVGFRLDYGNGTVNPNAFRMSQPASDIKDYKAKKDGTYTTFVNTVIPYKDSEGNVYDLFTLGNEWSFTGFAEDSTAKIYHEILPGDTFINFDLTDWTSAT
jgi:hypothetical protein